MDTAIADWDHIATDLPHQGDFNCFLCAFLLVLFLQDLLNLIVIFFPEIIF